MVLKISASSLFKYHYLVVTATGVKFNETYGFSSARRVPFSEIVSVLMGPDHTLYFQVLEEVFSIPTKPRKRKHQAVIAALLEGVRRSDPVASAQGTTEVSTV